MKKAVFIFALILVVSCTSNTIYEKPKDLIPKDTMVFLIKDLIVAKVAKNQKNKNQEIRINYLPLVYNKFKIDSLRFEKSNFYYTSKLEVYEELILEVKKQIVQEKNQLKERLQQKDSLKKDTLKTSKGKYFEKDLEEDFYEDFEDDKFEQL